MGWIDCFVITLIFCITTGYLIFLLHVRGWLFISLFIVICCKTFAMVFSMVHLQCFYGDRITRAKLCKNFCVSDFLCNCLSLSLSLKSLAHVQFHTTIIFIIKEASWCKIFQTGTAPPLICVSVFSKYSILPIPPCSVSWCFSNSFFWFRAYFDLLYLATQSLRKTALFSISEFANSLSLNWKYHFFNLTGRVSWNSVEIYFLWKRIFCRIKA